jgi:hypothetical protein
VLLAAAALVVASLMALVVPRPAGAATALRDRWRWPLHGAVVGRFAYAREQAFAAGARRGIDIAAAPGAVVRSACRGRVTFAGAVPGGRGRGVTVRCGALVATHLGLGRLAVRRGARVLAGTRLGALGRDGRFRLGARRAADRFGYVDPLALLGGDREPGLPAVSSYRLRRGPRLPVASPHAPRDAPLGRSPHAAPPLARAPHATPSPRRIAPRPRPAAHGRPAPAIPPGAWAGLVLLAAGVPLGGLVRRGRLRRAPGAAPTTTAVGR